MIMEGCGKKSVGVAFFSFLWFILLLLSLANWRMMKTRSDHIITANSLNKSMQELEVDDHEIKDIIGIHFVTKRRVPNGPDPIHNRRIGNSKLPPT